jgi:hypothetical protein
MRACVVACPQKLHNEVLAVQKAGVGGGLNGEAADAKESEDDGEWQEIGGCAMRREGRRERAAGVSDQCIHAPTCTYVTCTYLESYVSAMYYIPCTYRLFLHGPGALPPFSRCADMGGAGGAGKGGVRAVLNAPAMAEVEDRLDSSVITKWVPPLPYHHHGVSR